MKKAFNTPLLLLLFSIFLPCTHAKEKWIIAQAGNLEIFSNTYEKRTQTIAAELLHIQQTLSHIFPSLTDGNYRNIRVFILKNADVVSQFAPLYNGQAKRNLGGWFTHDLEGPLMVIKASSDVNETRDILYHEFIHFITSSPTTQLPPWLSEGIAEVFSSIEIDSKKTKIGKAIPENTKFLKYFELMEMEKLFGISRGSKEFNESDEHRGVFYAQSWALVHYLFFGEHKLPKDTFSKLTKLAIDNPSFSEEQFIETVGYNYEEMREELNRYVLGGNYYYNLIDTVSQNVSEFTTRKANDAEISLIQGILLLSSRGPEDAQSYLTVAQKELPNDPLPFQYQGYLNYKKELWQLTIENLEKAIALGSKSSSAYLQLASAKLNMLGESNQLDKTETKDLLKLLYEAKSLGDFSPHLYYCISKVWAQTTITLKDVYLKPLIEGIQIYPSNPLLSYYLAFCYSKMDQFDKANKTLDDFMNNPNNKGTSILPLITLKKQISKS